MPMALFETPNLAFKQEIDYVYEDQHNHVRQKGDIQTNDMYNQRVKALNDQEQNQMDNQNHQIACNICIYIYS